jgi:hypothetical protein
MEPPEKRCRHVTRDGQHENQSGAGCHLRAGGHDLRFWKCVALEFLADFAIALLLVAQALTAIAKSTFSSRAQFLHRSPT